MRTSLVAFVLICGSVNAQCYRPQIIYYCPPQQVYRPVFQASVTNVAQPKITSRRSIDPEPLVATSPKPATSPLPTTSPKPAAPKFDDSNDSPKPAPFVPMTDESKEEILKEIRSIKNELRDFKNRLDKLEQLDKVKHKVSVKYSNW